MKMNLRGLTDDVIKVLFLKANRRVKVYQCSDERVVMKSHNLRIILHVQILITSQHKGTKGSRGQPFLAQQSFLLVGTT